VQCDVHDPATLARLMAGQDAVISLVGILKGGEGDPYGKGFARAHVELPRKIAAAAKAAGVRRVLHVSALKTSADAPSGYLRSKADGEAALRDAGLDLTLFRPSVIFGRGDSFLTLFARMAAIAPFFPLAGADARFQPVWVEDVAATVADSLLRADSIGAAYDLCGPTQYSLRELVGYAAAVAGHPRAHHRPAGSRRLVAGLGHGVHSQRPDDARQRPLNARAQRLRGRLRPCPSAALRRRWKSWRRPTCAADTGGR
jgi:uncharacterized protein YbjT (DUF2867 family)